MAIDLESDSSGVLVTRDPAKATTWKTIYERDLRTLPSQSLMEGAAIDGNYGVVSRTIDGLPWTISAWMGHASIVAGSGLRMYAADTQYSGLPYGGLGCTLNVTALPGYDPAKSTACMVRYQGTLAPVVSTGGGFGVALGSSSNRMVLTQRYLSWRTRSEAGSATVEFSQGDDYRDDSGATPERWVFGCFTEPSGPLRRGLCAHRRWTLASMPTFEQLSPVFGTSIGWNSTDYGMGFFCEGQQGNQSDPSGYYGPFWGTFIRIMQRAPNAA